MCGKSFKSVVKGSEVKNHLKSVKTCSEVKRRKCSEVQRREGVKTGYNGKGIYGW